MGWFDEQIKQRKFADSAAFEDSFLEIAEAVMDRRLGDALYDQRKVTTDAIGEILRYYRVKPEEVPDSIKDLNEVLEFLMRPYGIMRRTVKLGKGWYKDAVGAMLGTLKEDGTVIALIPKGVSGYCYFDHKTGRNVRISHKNADKISEEAYAFYKPFPLNSMNVASFAKYLFSQIALSDVVLLGITMALVTGAGMVMPKLNAMLFSDVLESGSGRSLIGIGVFMICATLTSLIIGIAKSLASARINTKMNVTVEGAAMMRVLSMPASFFKQYNAGELSSRLGYVRNLSDQIVNMTLSTGLTSLFSLAYISQIFIYAPSLVIPSIAVTLINIAISILTIIVQVRVSRQQMLVSSKAGGISHSLITGIQKIRLTGAEKRAFGRWGSIYSKYLRLTYNPPLFIRVGGTIGTAVSLVGTILIYYTAVENNVSIAEYYAFNSAYGMVSAAFLSLVTIASTIARIKPTLEMVKPILETVPEIDENKKMVTKLSGAIELNNISFRYREDMPLVLDNVSLKIHPGQYIAIVGKTGCGKSTLVRMLLGFEIPQKGAVYYDGKDIKTLDLKSLRRRIGSVMQDGKLFMGDIFSNIVVSAPWLTLKEAWEAAEIAGLDKDIGNMPMGMHTLISEGQGGISGGQRQRMMIARAVAPKPKILIFDEATSALDNLTQKKVSEALDKMKCTRIVIAHRLSTIRQCDRIIVLDGGHIIEDGTYEELIEKRGFFADLVERQRLDTEENAAVDSKGTAV